MINAINASDLGAVLEVVSEIVGSTLGPKGKYVLVGNENSVQSTKDGVSVLKVLFSDNKYENNVLSLIKKSALSVLREAGDGTTSTILLANKMMKGLVSKRYSIEELSNKIKHMIEKLDDIKESVEGRIREVILTSVAGDEELTDIIYEAFKKAGSTNIVVEKVFGTKTYVEEQEGVFYKAYLASTSFNNMINKELKDPVVVVYKGILETEREVVEFFEKVYDKYGPNKDIVFITNGYAQDALGIITINHLQGEFNILPLHVAKEVYFDEMKLLSSVLGVEMTGIDINKYLEYSDPQCIKGTCKFDGKVVLFSGLEDDTKLDPKSFFYEELDEDTIMNAYNFVSSICNKKIVTIKIGYRIENKAQEIKDRIDDALFALKNSIEYGVVPGKGETYIKLNRLTEKSDVFEDVFSVIKQKIDPENKIKTEVYDSAKTIEAVLMAAYELSYMLYNTSAIIYVPVEQLKKYLGKD